jgi:hypothetical protein
MIATGAPERDPAGGRPKHNEHIISMGHTREYCMRRLHIFSGRRTHTIVLKMTAVFDGPHSKNRGT